MKHKTLKTLKISFVYVAFLASMHLLHAQTALHFHLNPVHIPGVTPFSIGIGVGQEFEQLTIAVSVLYTKMNPAVSGDGDYRGVRIVGDFKWPLGKRAGTGLTIFPTYWQTTVPAPDEQDEATVPKNRIKWGVGAGIFKTFTLYKKLEAEIIVGPEINQKILFGESFREVTYAPRLRTDFKLVWKL